MHDGDAPGGACFLGNGACSRSPIAPAHSPASPSPLPLPPSALPAAERDWYRSEALRLDAFCSSLKADVEYLRDKVTALEEDRGWLERQLKASKRNTALLGATGGAAGQALDLTGDGGAGSDADEEGVGGAGVAHPSGAGPASDAAAVASGRAGILATSFPGGASTAAKRWGTGPKLRKPTGPVSADPFARSGGGGGTGASAPLHLTAAAASSEAAATGLRAAGGPAQPHRTAAAEAATAALIRRLEAQLANATRQLETYRTRTSRLKAANTSLRSSRGELETFFLQCVEDVRKEVARRRVRNVVSSTPIAAAAGAMAMSSGGGGHTAAAVESNLASSTGVDTAVALARARQVSLADFTGEDRRAVVSRLLQDEYVLQALHDVIFAGAGGGEGAGDGGHGSMPSLPPYGGGEDAGVIDAGSTGGEEAAAGGGYAPHRATAGASLQPGLQHYPGER